MIKTETKKQCGIHLKGTSKYSFAAILHCLLPHLLGSNAGQNPILLALFAFKLRQNPTQSCVPLVFRGALKTKVFRCILIVVIFIFLGCKRESVSYNNREETQQNNFENSFALQKQDEALQKHAADIVNNMSDAALCAQLIMSGIDSRGALNGMEAERLKDMQCGAIMLFGKNLNTSAENIKVMTNDIYLQYTDVLPFIALDEEGGLVHRLPEGLPVLPPPLSYYQKWQQAHTNEKGTSSALNEINTDAQSMAKALSALGINMNLAPIAEVLTVANNDFLQTRSYGYDSQFVSDACTTFIQAMQNNKVVCVIKHFPGNSLADPHFDKPVLNGTVSEIETYTKSFKQIISGGNVYAVMISHVIVPAWDADNNCSLSKIVINEKLRGDFNFSGIVIADDFAMAAVADIYGLEESAVKAVDAGVDMLMAWPATLYTTHNALLKALKNKTLAKKRLQEAARRIVYEKLRFGLVTNE
ncbi:MAG: hypothetical protein Ta2B_06040 [Termitinemataceae bacterium]|nr:MAG: hypothetical protein Ta2B_06040 [Termitinemataceae bacterium]